MEHNLKNLSLTNKLIISLLLAGLIPCLFISYFVYNKTSDVLIKEAKDKLILSRETRAFQIESLYETLHGQVKALAYNQITINAVEEFQTAYEKYSQEITYSKETVTTSLEKYYVEQFSKEYSNKNLNKSFNQSDDLISKLSQTTKNLQYSFISNSKFNLGEKDQLYDIQNNTTYGKTHAKYHDTYRSYLNQFGFYDIFIVNPSGDVVYSVYKELDYATNLLNGPYANTALASAFNGAKSLNKGESFVTELKKYLPSYDAPAQFISSPIFNGEKFVGTLVFQIPVAKIDHIMTGNRNWKELGQGLSGETYLIDRDKKMMSISRFIAEDEAGFLESMKNLNLAQESLDYIKSKKTSALEAQINTEGANSAVLGKTDFKIFNDYRGVNVLSAYKPLKLQNLNWFILSEMDESEALDSVYYIAKIISILVGVSVILITIFSIFFSKSIAKSLIDVAFKINKGAENILEASTDISDGARELSSATHEQSTSLQETSASVNEISAMVEKSTLNAQNTADLSLASQKNAEKGKIQIENLKKKIEEIHQNNTVLVESVDENNASIENIKQVIEEIFNKTKVINEIVFQTKLLSFNASVESARAGEHGKGFAVVAEEVGALALMSGKAASEIAELLERSKQQVSNIVESSKNKITTIVDEGKLKVEEGIREVISTHEVLNGLVSDFQKVNASVQEISSSSKEQSVGVNEINQAISQLDAAMQQSSLVAHKSSQRSNELNHESELLEEITANLQLIVFGSSKHSKKKKNENIINLDDVRDQNDEDMNNTDFGKVI